jgi:hypothetical protein
MAAGDAALMDVGAVEAPVVDTPEVDSGTVEQVDQPEQQQQTDGAQQPQPSFEKDGKPSQAALKSAFQKLRELDPKLAEHIRGQYHLEGSIRSMFPGGVQEARALKETFDTLGGEEGITTLRTEAQEYADELAMVSEGNPKVVDNIFASSPEGAAKLTEYSFSKLRNVNPERYAAISMSGFSDVLRQNGFPDGVNTMAAAIGALVEDIANGKQERAHDQASNLSAWFKKFQQMGAKPAGQQEVDPRQKELDTREQTIRQQEEANFRTGFNTKLNSELVIPSFKKMMGEFFKGKNLTTEQKQRIEKNFYTDLAEEFSKDDAFKSKRDIVLKRKDEKALMNLYRPRLEEIAPKVFKSVTVGLGWRRAPNATDNLGNGNGNANPAMLAAKPRSEDINWDKDKSRARFMRGEATLRNGKEVKWDWNAVK